MKDCIVSLTTYAITLTNAKAVRWCKEPTISVTNNTGVKGVYLMPAKNPAIPKIDKLMI